MSEYKSKQQHIADRPAGDREQHLAFPEMEHDGDCDRDQFREAVGACQKADVLQAVDDEHAEDGGRKNFADILDESRRFLILPEDEKWKKSGEHRAEHAQADCDDLLWNGHISVPPVVVQALDAAV